MDHVPTAAFNWRSKASEIFQRSSKNAEEHLETVFVDLDKLSESYPMISQNYRQNMDRMRMNAKLSKLNQPKMQDGEIKDGKFLE
jgi:hypothetical protein